MTFQPYQMAAEEEKKQGVLPLKIAKKAAIIAGSLSGGGQLLKLLPFLNRLVPEKIARQGMAKILPKTEEYFNGSEKAGHPFDQAREFLREKLAPLSEEEERKLSPEEKRIETLGKFNQKIRGQRPQSEFSREGLMEQFQGGQQQQGQQGKAALLQTMQEITQALRQMRGQGG